MTFIYDIILNFTDNYYYDFYEWDKKDNLVNVKKIPLIHVNKKTIKDFINYNIMVNKSLLESIDNKSIFLRKDKEKYNNVVIISSGEKSLGLCFDNNGIILYKSSMLLDEENEANLLALKQKETKLNYKKLKYNKNKLLRSDIEKKNSILKELKKAYLNKEYDKLKYIYYDLYNKTSNDINVIYNILIHNIEDLIYKDNDIFYNLITK